MKFYKGFLFLPILFSGIISCKKNFLDVPDNSILLRQAYVNDLKTSEDFLNGIYVELGSNFYRGYHMIYPDLIADDIKPISGSMQLFLHYNWSQQVDDSKEYNPESNMNSVWRFGYKIARESSFVIETVDEYRSQNTEKADHIKGQAYTIRALVHFVLINTFAQSYNFSSGGLHPGIPYVNTSDWTVSVTTRQSVNDVYNSMIADLQHAIQLLSQSSTNASTINRNAAKALLARIYLFKEDYQAAKNLAREVAIAIPIMTGANYPSKLFTAEGTEAIFQLPPSWEGVNGGTYSNFFAGIYFTDPLKQFLATNDIATVIKEDPEDARNIWVTQNAGEWEVSKFPRDVVPDFPVGTQAYYPTLIRSSEMYLTASESYAKLNNEDSARYFLDAIRLRANPASLPSTATGALLLDLIYKERRKELAFEGFRMFDLLRWKKGVNRTDATNSASLYLQYPNNKAIAPIPLSDVSLNGFSQNPGY